MQKNILNKRSKFSHKLPFLPDPSLNLSIGKKHSTFSPGQIIFKLSLILASISKEHLPKAIDPALHKGSNILDPLISM